MRKITGKTKMIIIRKSNRKKHNWQVRRVWMISLLVTNLLGQVKRKTKVWSLNQVLLLSLKLVGKILQNRNEEGVHHLAQIVYQRLVSG
jgi:hypothetical protein